MNVKSNNIIILLFTSSVMVIVGLFAFGNDLDGHLFGDVVSNYNIGKRYNSNDSVVDDNKYVVEVKDVVDENVVEESIKEDENDLSQYVSDDSSYNN